MLEMGLFWLGVAVVVVALLMLFQNAFKQNKIWGIAGLVFLLPLLVHIFIGWEALAVRKATYALIIGVLAVFVSIAGGALAHMPFLPKHEVVQSLEENIAPPKETPLPNEEQAQAITNSDEDYDPLLSGSEFEEVDVEKMVPPSSSPVRKTTQAAKYQSLPAEDLALAINKQVRLTMTSGKVVEGVLTHLGETAATVETVVEGGSLGLSYNLSEVKSMEVRLAAGEQLAPPVETEELAPAQEPQIEGSQAEGLTVESIEPSAQMEQLPQEVQGVTETIIQEQPTQEQPKTELIEQDMQGEAAPAVDEQDAVIDSAEEVEKSPEEASSEE